MNLPKKTFQLSFWNRSWHENQIFHSVLLEQGVEPLMERGPIKRCGNHKDHWVVADLELRSQRRNKHDVLVEMPSAEEQPTWRPRVMLDRHPEQGGILADLN